MTRGAAIWAALAIASGTAAAARSQDAGHPVEIEGDAVRLSDLAVVPASMADPVVARLPPGETRLALSTEAVAAILRRQAPGRALQPLLAGDRLFVRRPIVAPDRTAGCGRLNQPVAQGDFITAEMVSPAVCTEDERAAVAFNRDTRSLVASADLPAGAWLGRVALPEGPAPVPNAAPLRLQVRSGPVVIEREVRTLQAARPGDRVFVATAEGDVVAARIAPEGNERTAQ